MAWDPKEFDFKASRSSRAECGVDGCNPAVVGKVGFADKFESSEGVRENSCGAIVGGVNEVNCFGYGNEFGGVDVCSRGQLPTGAKI